jgi:hypothetical protein
VSPHPPRPEKPHPLAPARMRPSAPGPDGDRGTKDDGRQAVPSALPPEPHAITVTGIQPGLQIRMAGGPLADWLCACGHHERARGRKAVADLASRVIVGICPHRTAPAQERRNAA